MLFRSTGSGNVANWLNQSVFFGADMKTSSRWTLSGLYLRTTAVTNFSYVPDNVAAALMAHNPATSAVVKFGANYQASQSLSGGVYTGVLTEQGQTLGMHTGGAFSLGDGTTYIGGVNVKADLTDSTSVTAFAEQSATSSFGNQNSLLATDTWRGSKYGLSLTQNGLLGLSGVFRMTLVRPWQIDQGAIRAHVPVGRELDGTIDYQDRMVSVASGNMPLELGLAYLSGGAAFKYGAELKMLDHSLASAQGAPEVSLAAALHWSF